MVSASDPYQAIYPNYFSYFADRTLVFFRHCFQYSSWVSALGSLYLTGYSDLCRHYIVFSREILVTVCLGRAGRIIWNQHRS